MIKLRAAVFILMALASPWAVADEPRSAAAQINDAFKAYQEAEQSGDASAVWAAANAAYVLATELDASPETLIVLADNYALSIQRRNGFRRSETLLRVLEHEIELIEQHWGPDSEALVNPLRDYARAQYQQDFDQGDSRRRFRRVEDLIDQHFSEPDLDRASRLYQLAEAQLYSGATSDGDDNLEKAIEIYHDLLPDEDVRIGLAHHLAGRLVFAQRDYEEAIEYFERSTTALAPDGVSRNPAGLSAYAFLVQSYSELGDEDKATEYCLEIGRSTPAQANADYEPIYRIPPRYPRSAASQGIEGWVVLEFTVDEQGFVRNPVAIDSEFSKNDRPARTERAMINTAIDAVNKFRYAPRFEDGEAVATHGVKNRFSFELAN